LINVATSAHPLRRWQYADGLEVYVHYPISHGKWAGQSWQAQFFAVCAIVSVPASRALRIRL
jgi:hypothetical protein